MKTSQQISSRAVALLRTLSVCGALASPLSAWAYSEDINLATDGHSTFHYELTRTLARASGFSAADAEQIGLANSATDTFPNEVSTCTTTAVSGRNELVVVGTARNTPVESPYFHWPRRGSVNVTHGQPYPGGVNTCDYFANTADTCPAGEPELNELEKWALLGQTWAPTGNAAALTVPCYSQNKSAYASIQPGTLLALAVYLHSLSDSYSHQACMRVNQVRNHDEAQSIECEAMTWHQSQEYGDGVDDAGVSDTGKGAQAVWDALKRYRELKGAAEAALWSDATALDFIKIWAAFEDAQDRSDYATKAYETLNGGSTSRR